MREQALADFQDGQGAGAQATDLMAQGHHAEALPW